jgi:hypothetical protein
MLAVSSQENPSTQEQYNKFKKESRELVITIENTCTSNNTQTIVPSEVTVNEKKEKDKKKMEKKDNKENKIRVLFIHMPLYFERPVKIMIIT